jgi:DNA-directed RNA polymerase III subunit RPC8
VLLDVGLCIGFYDFEEVGDPYVYPAEGACHQYVRFRLIVFRPFVGEAIIGRVYKVTSEGLHVSLNFFSDIFIPRHLLQQPSEYSHATNTWAWKYEEAEGQTGPDFWITTGDMVSIIRFLAVVVCPSCCICSVD